MPRIFVLLSAVCFGTTGTAQALGPDAAPITVGAVRIAIGGGLLLLVPPAAPPPAPHPHPRRRARRGRAAAGARARRGVRRCAALAAGCAPCARRRGAGHHRAE